MEQTSQLINKRLFASQLSEERVKAGDLKKMYRRANVIMTNLTQVRHQMHSLVLLKYLSFNCFSNGIVSGSWCYFVQIQPGDPISQK